MEEIRKIFAAQVKTAQAVANKLVSADMIPEVSYSLLRQGLAKVCGISVKKAALAIGNLLDCAPIEDLSRLIFMLPN